MIRTAVVSDDDVIRVGICVLIDSAPDIAVVTEVEAAQAASDRIDETQLDVAVIDVRCPARDRIDLSRTLISRHPGLRCLILAGHGPRGTRMVAMAAAQSGFSVATFHSDNLVESIRRLAGPPGGQAEPSPERVRHDGEPGSMADAHDDQLTRRQQQVLTLLAEGMSNRQIGTRLGLTEKTVKNYVSGLLANLGLASRTQAAVYRATRHER